MKVFIVNFESIYGRKINGVFSSYEKAEACRNKLEAEIDEYNDDEVVITIVEKELNEE